MRKASMEVIQDLKYFRKKGQIGFDLSNFKYYQMFCNALEATGTSYHLEVNELEGNIIVIKMV
ncbi:hypothetical protein CN568_26525 [Bacillus pseudomycoides]|uniref:hypothetical protein n=1 Tax=Bacillus TaxID=1386 RepID=UPI000BEDF1F0|nr:MULTISPECIES: hypothetical protein [Bacillus]MCX2829851.1 hypothetical protein [Bacillus sp. DHT2]MDR4918878.1 hypothetical protein [Bacillus pseudomycoides]PDZ74478.1 hypothetical protein CON58_06725 [Bacillus pseudomycoides]PEF72023.1 hypothetical protein CON94_28635 [Bacillus pseudomycoides]PEK37228.1 hypothetical protein CN691_07735 [Bacillus pseudomycoides]